MSTTEIVAIAVGLLAGYWIVWRVLKSTGDSPRGSSNAENTTAEFHRRPDTEPNVPKDWFRILEVPENASHDLIVAAYKRQISQYHPDKVAQMGADIRQIAESKSKLINAAYDFALKLGR